jgi:hypothetical protein
MFASEAHSGLVNLHLGNALQPTNRPPALLHFLATRVTRLEPHCGQVSWGTVSTNSGGVLKGLPGTADWTEGY